MGTSELSLALQQKLTHGTAPCADSPALQARIGPSNVQTPSDRAGCRCEHDANARSELAPEVNFSTCGGPRPVIAEAAAGLTVALLAHAMPPRKASAVGLGPCSRSSTRAGGEVGGSEDRAPRPGPACRW